MILVGTVHVDINGPRRLEQVLNTYKPKSVSLEIPSDMDPDELEQFIFGIRKSTKAAVEDSGIEENNSIFIFEAVETFGYEACITIEYCRTNDSTLHFSDHPALNNPWKKYLKEFGDETIERLPQWKEKPLKIKDYESFRRAYTQKMDGFYFVDSAFELATDVISRISEEDRKKFTETKVKETKHMNRDFKEEREQYMAENILRIKPDIHIGGVGHAFKGFVEVCSAEPLYRRLGDTVTKRIRLCEVDGIYQNTENDSLVRFAEGIGNIFKKN